MKLNGRNGRKVNQSSFKFFFCTHQHLLAYNSESFQQAQSYSRLQQPAKSTIKSRPRPKQARDADDDEIAFKRKRLANNKKLVKISRSSNQIESFFERCEDDKEEEEEEARRYEIES